MKSRPGTASSGGGGELRFGRPITAAASACVMNSQFAAWVTRTARAHLRGLG